MRTQFTETVVLPDSTTTFLAPLSGVNAVPYNVNPDGTEGSLATAYASRTGSTLAPRTATDTSGTVSYWLEQGEYNIHFADPNNRIAAFIRGFSSEAVDTSVLAVAYTGDFKFSMQAGDHGASSSGAYAWLLVQSASDGGGRLVAKTTYAGLWQAIGQPATDVNGNFRLPNVSGRVFVATGHPTGLSNYVFQGSGGFEVVQLDTGMLPSHSHANAASATGLTVANAPSDGLSRHVPVGGFWGTIDVVTGATGTTSSATLPYNSASSGTADGDSGLVHNHGLTDPTHSHSSASVGGNVAHENRSPYMGMNLFIKS